jgi:hypothetical protein
LLLTREKFYEGAGYVCRRTGAGPRDMDLVWIPFPWRGFHSRGLDHEVTLPLRALRRAGGMDAFVTIVESTLESTLESRATTESMEVSTVDPTTHSLVRYHEFLCVLANPNNPGSQLILRVGTKSCWNLHRRR